MKRKILASVLALVLLLCFALPVGAADTALSIRGPDTAPEVGESFTVTVEITGNPGIGSAQFTLEYDQTLLKCTEMEPGEVLKGALFASNPSLEEGAKLAAASAYAMNGDGTLCTLTFTVQKAADGYRLAIRDVSLNDGERNKLGFTVKDAVIPGTGPAVETPEPTNPAEPTETTEPTPPPETTPTAEPDQPEPPEGGEAAAPAITFTDIETHWGREYILKAAEQKLFDGYPDGTFRPKGEVTRGQFVTVLWRMAGSPQPETASAFTDTAEGKWYSDAVAWASEKGYVNGYPDGTFRPNDSLTREQAMKILFGYNGGVSGQELMYTSVYNTGFADSDSISSWAKSAMYWAYYHELISGTSTGTTPTLSPRKTATRAEIAKILVLYAEKFSA